MLHQPASSEKEEGMALPRNTSPVLRTYVCFFQLKNKQLGVVQYRDEDLTLVMGSVWVKQSPLQHLDITVLETVLERPRLEEAETVERLLLQMRPDVVVRF